MSINSTNEERTKEYFEKFNREKTLKFLVGNDNPIILDIGANVGKTVDEFKAWWPESVIYCFEPQEECWDELLLREEKFRVGKVYVNKFALGNQNKIETFYTHKMHSGISGFNKINLDSVDSVYLNKVLNEGKEDINNYKRIINHERSIEIKRVDDFIKEQENFPEIIDLVKIDTQGFEPEVLDGFGNDLKNVKVILTELMFYDYYERSLSFTDIEKYLIPAGFRLYDISHIAKNPMNGRTDWVDVIYVNNSFRGI
jgi:FkbM family methyltransferase